MEEVIEVTLKSNRWKDVIRCPHCAESGLRTIYPSILECGEGFTLNNGVVTWHGGCEANNIRDWQNLEDMLR